MAFQVQMRLWPPPEDRKQLAFTAEVRPPHYTIEDLAVARELNVPEILAERFLVALCARHLTTSPRFSGDRQSVENGSDYALRDLSQQPPPNIKRNRVGTPRGW